QRPERRVSAAVGGHQPHEARLLRRPDDEPERVVHLPARERGERVRHRVDALVHRQQPPDLVLVQNPHCAHVNNPPIRSTTPSPSLSSRAASTGSSCSAVDGPHTAPSASASTHANASADISTPRASASSRSRSSASKTRPF